MRALCDGGYLVHAPEPVDPEYSSLDLHLDDEAYELSAGSIKPSGRSYLHFINRHGLTKRLSSNDGTYILEPRRTYLFRIKERLDALGSSGIYGQATAKSTIGRMDVLARLVVDGMSKYEGFTPDELQNSSGDMFIELTSMTFRVRVKVGISLSQLRLFYGQPTVSEMTGPELWRTVLHHPDNCDHVLDDTLSVDLSETPIGEVQVAAFEVADQDETADPINLWADKADATKLLDPCKFWKFLKADQNERLEIEERRFYILRSKERLSLPKGVAAYCRAIDETIGEMRIHYAGFVHPLFGVDRVDKKPGTPLIFEVRGHDLNASLIDGEKMARLTFYRMSEDAELPSVKPSVEDPYNDQELKLSKLFRPWPGKIKVDNSGTPREAL